MTMRTIIAPEPTQGYAHDVMSSDFAPCIFLAGAIDMGAAVDWQAYVIEQLRDKHCTLFNPRRATPFTPEMLDEQILWELDALEAADVVFMWFPRDSKAPVAMFESGLYLQSGKLLLGAEDGFYRRRNLELTAQYFNRRIYDSLDEMIATLSEDWL